MLIEELGRLASSNATVDDVKSLIWQINGFSPTRKAVEKLKPIPIFPVKAASRSTASAVLRAQNENFSIIDRQPWADAFQGQIDFLDFSLEEVRKLHPFLSSFDLENRYLSRAIAETSSFQGEVREQSRKRTRQLRNRAYAIARCAAHFNSPRIRDDDVFIYRLLRQVEVFETDGIVGNLVHTQKSETVSVEISKSKLHISEVSGILKIYVPKDRKDQELCFLQLLPRKLFNMVIMGNEANNLKLASDSEAVRIIALVFMSSDEVVSDLLDDAGIIPVMYPDDFNTEDSEHDHTISELAVQYKEYPQISREFGQSPVESVPSSSRTGFLSPTPPSSHRSTYRAATPTYTQPSIPSFNSRPFTPRNNEALHFSVNSGQEEYRRLLSNVIVAAKSKRGGFPTQGSFNLDALLNALPTESDAEPVSYELPFGVRSENQLAHDMKVGAAGELYVFEVLSRLESRLPRFDRSNWHSTIRRHVTIHEDYYGMDPWKGAETADITYDDTDGDFTKLLVENEYLDNIWIGAKPKYYLEVKSTTKECGARFYVSKSQYQRMERMRMKEGEVPPEVYIIFRVFNLDKDSIDMRLYVDPIDIEERGSLVFTPASYTILPAGSADV